MAGDEEVRCEGVGRESTGGSSKHTIIQSIGIVNKGVGAI